MDEGASRGRGQTTRLSSHTLPRGNYDPFPGGDQLVLGDDVSSGGTAARFFPELAGSEEEGCPLGRQEAADPRKRIQEVHTWAQGGKLWSNGS